MRRKLIVGTMAAGALAITAGSAFALSSGGTSNAGAVQPTTSASTTTTSTASSTTTSTTSGTASTSETATSTPTATDTATDTSGAPTRTAGTLSADDASRIVTDRWGGTVHEVEREVEHGRLEWKVEVTAGDGRTYDVRVDAGTGAVTRVDADDDRGGDDRGRGGDDD
jgi:uncharacterized membrane protein YkoI